MPASALSLTLAAAFVHALWNVLVARSRDPEAATAVALAVAVVAFAPAAVLTWDVEADATPYVIASTLLELAFFALLATAYRRADLSLVYPIARGLAPVLVLAVAALALAERPGALEALGVLLIAVGVVLVRGLRRPAAPAGTLFAVAVAACIAGYTLVDAEGLEHAAPLPYLELVLLGPALVYAASLAALRGASTLRDELRPSSVAAGVAMFGAYALVLAALERAPAAPVAAIRETSVVIAAGLAAVVLRERVSLSRLAGAVLVVAGIALLAAA